MGGRAAEELDGTSRLCSVDRGDDAHILVEVDQRLGGGMGGLQQLL